MLKGLMTAVLATGFLLLGSVHRAEAARDVLTVDLVNEPSSLDPHVQWNPDSYYVYRNIFDNLVTRDDSGKIVPEIATAWRQISDTEIEFDIRKGVKFHDGTPLTAEDVAYSIHRIISPDFKSPQLSQFNRIDKATAVGADKLRIVTKGPYPVLLAQLVKLSIVPKAHVEKVGRDEFNLKPVGSGPYRFAGWQRGVRVTLEANPDYWGVKGSFPKAEFNAVPDVATRMANLRSGRSDLVVTLGPDQAAELRNDPRAQVLSVLTERVAYLRLNAAHGPLADLKLRQAAAAAIDRATLVEALLGNFDKVMNILGSPASFGYVDGFAGPKYDPALAKRLVQELGAAAQQEMTFITAPVFDQRIVQALHQMLTEVGFKVRIVSSDMQTYLRRATGPAPEAGDFAFGRWSCACQDADGMVEPLFHSKSIWAKYASPEMDAALEAARSTLDEAKRLEHYRKVHEIAARDLPMVPLYQAAILYGASKKVQWKPTPNESMFINRMKWVE